MYNPQRQYAVLVIDINLFNTFVDSFGHDEGNVLLKYFAALLKQLFQEYGVVLRQRDDIFIALLANRSREEVNHLTQQVLTLLDCYRCNKTELRLNIGWYYSDNLDVTRANELDFAVMRANQALSQVKEFLGCGAIQYTHSDESVTSLRPQFYDDYHLISQ